MSAEPDRLARRRPYTPAGSLGGVDGAGRGQWGRMLLLVAVLFGVVAMHSLVVPAASAAGMPGMGEGSAASVMAAEPPVATAQHSPAPAPDQHAGMLHMCLAVMAGMLALGVLLVVALLARQLIGTAPVRAPTRVVAVQPRPPPPMAVRLAQLCVMRN